MRTHTALAIAAALLAASPLFAAPALADRGELELSIGPQLFVPYSDSVHPLTDSTDLVTTSARASYALLELLDVYLGYRWTGTLRRTTDDGVSTRADQHGVAAGARLRYPLIGGWLRAYGQLELEVNLAQLTLEVANRRGSQSSWGAGLVPEIGLEARAELGAEIAAVVRLGVGYALRLDHRFDTLALDLDAPAARPLDLGSANLSGLTFGFTLGVRF